VLASDISPDFRCWMAARVAAESLSNVLVVAATVRDPLPSYPQSVIHAALMVDVYHHLEFPRTVCRRIRSLLHPDVGRLIVIDFHRDPARVKGHPADWVMNHLRADQDVFRSEVLSCGTQLYLHSFALFIFLIDSLFQGFVLESEPALAELCDNYIMVFRPASSDEIASTVGVGWANSAFSAAH